MTDRVVRVTTRVPLAEAEEARAAALDLLPGGFEELEVDGAFVLALYVDESDVEAIRRVFSDLSVDPVAPGWEDAWRAFHRPARAGGLWIGPPWEQPDGGERAVVIDPGRAFGTGAHPTTRLCVELLASVGLRGLSARRRLRLGGALDRGRSLLGFFADPCRRQRSGCGGDDDRECGSERRLSWRRPVLDGELGRAPAAVGSGRGERPARSGGANPRSARQDMLRSRPAISRRTTSRGPRAGHLSTGSSSTGGPPTGSKWSSRPELPRDYDKKAAARARRAQPRSSSAERGTIGSCDPHSAAAEDVSAEAAPVHETLSARPEGARRCRWAQGSASRRPAHSTSPTRKR